MDIIQWLPARQTPSDPYCVTENEGESAPACGEGEAPAAASPLAGCDGVCRGHQSNADLETLCEKTGGLSVE